MDQKKYYTEINFKSGEMALKDFTIRMTSLNQTIFLFKIIVNFQNLYFWYVIEGEIKNSEEELRRDSW